MTDRRFTLDDQKEFAELSGDYNPVHLEASVAGRTLFGKPVVHGIHLVLWALDRWARTQIEPSALARLNVVFKNSLCVGQAVNCRLNTGSQEKRISLELSDNGVTLALIRGECRMRGPALPSVVKPENPPRRDCRQPQPQDIAKCAGRLELGASPERVARLFPDLAKTLPLTQIAELLAMTRLVGMECPGLYSVFSECALTFDDPPIESADLAYKVTHFFSRYSLVHMDVRGPSAKGALKAFLRPEPVRQKSYSEIRDKAGSLQLEGQKALVIGGSRGLGEVAVKCLAAAGAEVLFTFHASPEDAGRVADQIRAGAGRAAAVRFNVLSPEEASAEAVKQFSPTHVYYFATPFIATNKGAFSSGLYKEFCDFYVEAFTNLVCFCLRQCPSLRKVFYPSTCLIDRPVPFFSEYIKAKISGEAACLSLEKTYCAITIYRPRLPRLATDQTAGVFPGPAGDAVPVLLEHLKAFGAS